MEWEKVRYKMRDILGIGMQVILIDIEELTHLVDSSIMLGARTLRSIIAVNLLLRK
jgi:hypothetical protein